MTDARIGAALVDSAYALLPVSLLRAKWTARHSLRAKLHTAQKVAVKQCVGSDSTSS